MFCNLVIALIIPDVVRSLAVAANVTGSGLLPLPGRFVERAPP